MHQVIMTTFNYSVYHDNALENENKIYTCFKFSLLRLVKISKYFKEIYHFLDEIKYEKFLSVLGAIF